MGEGGHQLKKQCLPWGLPSHRRSEETGGGRGALKFKKWGDVFYGWSLARIWLARPKIHTIQGSPVLRKAGHHPWKWLLL